MVFLGINERGELYAEYMDEGFRTEVRTWSELMGVVRGARENGLEMFGWSDLDFASEVTGRQETLAMAAYLRGVV